MWKFSIPPFRRCPSICIFQRSIVFAMLTIHTICNALRSIVFAIVDVHTICNARCSIVFAIVDVHTICNFIPFPFPAYVSQDYSKGFALCRRPPAYNSKARWAMEHSTRMQTDQARDENSTKKST